MEREDRRGGGKRHHRRAATIGPSPLIIMSASQSAAKEFELCMKICPFQKKRLLTSIAVPPNAHVQRAFLTRAVISCCNFTLEPPSLHTSCTIYFFVTHARNVRGKC